MKYLPSQMRSMGYSSQPGGKLLPSQLEAQGIQTKESQFYALNRWYLQKKKQEDELKRLEEEFQRQQKANEPKMGFLGRLGSALSSFETGDASYKSLERYKKGEYDPLGFHKDYLKGIYEGLKGTVTGESSDFMKNKKTYTDVAHDFAGMQNKQGDKHWYNNIDAGDVVGFIGDVALDPTTYATFGTGGAAKITVKGGVKVLNKAGQKTLKNLADKYGAESASKILSNTIDKSPALAKKFVDTGGVKYFGKTIIPGSKFPTIMKPMAERGLITGGVSTALNVGEKIPGVRKVVTPVRHEVRSLFDKRYATGLVGKKYEKAIDDLDALTKKTNARIYSELQSFFKKSEPIFKKYHKQYGGVDGFGKAVYDYAEKGVPVEADMAKWVDNDLKPMMKKIADAEAKIGKLPETRQNYLYHMIGKDYASEKASQGFGKRTTGLKTTNPYAKSSGNFLEYVDDAGKKHINPTGLTEVKSWRGIPHILNEGQKNWIDSVEKILKKHGISLEFKPRQAVKRNALGYYSPRKKKIVIAADNPIEGLMRTISHEMSHGGQGLLGELGELARSFSGKTKKDQILKILNESADAVRKEFDTILTRKGINTGVLKGAQLKKATKVAENVKKEVSKINKELVKLRRQAKKTDKRLKAYKELNQKIDSLVAKRTVLRKEAKTQIKSLKGDVPKNLTSYYKKPTELMARAVEIVKANPQWAAKNMPETYRAVKEMQGLSKIIDRSLSKPDINLSRQIIPGRTFQDAEGKFYHLTGVPPVSDINKYGHEQGISKHDIFSTDVISASARRLADSIRLQESDSYLKGVANEFGVPIKEFTTNTVRDSKGAKHTIRHAESRIIDGEKYVPLDMAGAPKELQGVLLPEPLVKHFKETYSILYNPDATNKFLREYDKIINVFKASLTSPFPAFHVRNLQGGIFNNWLAGIRNPLRYSQAKIIMKSMKDGKDRTIKLGGREFSTSQIIQMARQSGIVGSTGQTDVTRKIVKDFDHNVLVRGVKKVLRSPMTATEKVENFLRLPLFMDGLAKGETAQMAAKRVMKFHFDYTPEALTRFERGLKRFILFYTWSRNNIPLQFEQLGKQPWKYGAVTKAMSTDRERYYGEQGIMPDWLKRTTSFQLPGGKQMSVGLPMSDMARAFSPAEWAQSVNPIAKTAVEAKTNYDIYRDKPITDKYDSKEEASKKRWEWIINAVAGRTVSTTRDINVMLSNDDTDKTYKNLGKVFFGVNVTDVNKQAPYQLREQLFKSLSPTARQAYDAAHIQYDDQYPLLASKRKATVYLDYPETFIADQMLKKFSKEKAGYEYDPIYDLPWDKARIVYAQQASGDKWNSKEMQKLDWFKGFQETRSKYFDRVKETKGADTIDMESDKYYKEPSSYVQSNMDTGNWNDPRVQAWLEQKNKLENDKRQAIGLITDEPYQKIQDQISEGFNKYKASTGKVLPYMQAIRASNPDAFSNFFSKHPDLDPSSDEFAGFKGGSGFKRGFSKKSVKRSTKAKKQPKAKAYTTKTKIAKVKGIPRSNEGVRLARKLVKEGK